MGELHSESVAMTGTDGQLLKAIEMMLTVVTGKPAVSYGVPEVPGNLLESSIRTGALIAVNERISAAEAAHEDGVVNILAGKAVPPAPKAPALRPVALPTSLTRSKQVRK